MADSPRIDELRRRVQTDPASIAFAALAEEYRRAGRFDEAVATCRAGLQRHPAYLSAHVTLGRAYLELGQYDEARAELEHVLRSAPENLAAIRGLAEIFHRRGDLADALKQYRAALTVAPHDLELQDTIAALTRETARQSPAAAIAVDLGTGVPAFDLAIAGRQAAQPDPVAAPAPSPIPVAAAPSPVPVAAAPSQAPPAAAAPIVAVAAAPALPLATTPPPVEASQAALAGLEEFLAAIVRARRERQEHEQAAESAIIRR